MVQIRKTIWTPRTLLIGGVTETTTLFLLLGAMLLHVPVFSTVQAMGTAPTPILYVSVPTAHHCNVQDPIAQSCSKDAQTIAFEQMLRISGISLGTVERRYSPHCHTYWGHLVGPPNGKRGLNIFLDIQGGPPSVSTITKNTVFTSMLFLPCTVQQVGAVTGTVSEKDHEDPTIPGVAGAAAFSH